MVRIINIVFKKFFNNDALTHLLIFLKKKKFKKTEFNIIYFCIYNFGIFNY